MLKRFIGYLKTEFSAVRNGKAFVFLVCLGLASFLWFLNALEKHYTDHITVPVRYVNLPKGKGLTGKLPEKFELIVDAYGYTLLQHKLNLAFPPILIDINELTNSNLESRYISKFSISTNMHKEEIAKQISGEIEVINIRPDTISFFVSNIIDKLVKVFPVTDLTFAREYILKKLPATVPESILVSGPENILDTLKYVFTKPSVLKNLSHDVVADAQLVFLHGLSSNVDGVKVKIEVEQYTEAKFDVPLLVINQPDSMLVKTFPSKIKVSCKVGLSKYNKLNISSFRAVTDYSSHSGPNSKLAVRLDQIPETVLSADYFPKEVEYIIERK